jgi:uncharacterized protein
MDVAISGASGLIGTALARALQADGHRPIALVRTAGQAGADAIHWDPDAGVIDAAGLEGIDAVVHLAGAGIGDHRWTDDYKRIVLESRTKGTTLLADTLAKLDRPPSVFVSGSAIGYYGDRDDQVLNEQSGPGSGFLADVCRAWESSAQPAVEAGIRTPIIRTGIVLSADGGALPKLLPLFKLGVGGKMGSGRQYWSWISIDDEVGAIRWLLDHDIDGPVNLTAPVPVTNADFTKTLGRVLGRPTFLTVPSFAPKLLRGAELAEQLLFYSQRVQPAVLESSGYPFLHADLEAALRAVTGRAEAA